MIEPRAEPTGDAPVWPIVDRLVKAAVCVLLAYWGLLALLTPITVTDSQVYNLGRLPIAERYGLFGNHSWYNSRQVAFPWSFDAIHWGFLKLGFGYALPSFLCLAGTLFVAFRLARAWAGRAAGWWAVLLLLAMPTIEFQATSTKNDLGLVFGLAAGFYFIWRYHQEREPLWLAAFALAVGFLPGIKDAGFISAAGLLLVAFWYLRSTPRRLALVLAGCAASALLFGSAEIYYNNWLTFGHVFGPADLVAALANRDGVRGALANFIRFMFGVTDLARTPPYGNPPYIPALEHACLRVLHAAKLANVGYFAGWTDANLHFARQGGETTSDYALLGTLLIPMAIWQIIRRQWSNPARWLAIAGFLYFAAISYSEGWAPWNARFLMPSFLLFALAFIVGEQRALAQSRVFRVGLFGVAAYSAVIPTWYSFNKQPERDLLGAVTQREWETYLELPPMAPIAHAAKDWLSAHPNGRLLFMAGSNSWVLPIFRSGFGRVDAMTELHLTAEQLPTAARPVAILTLERPDFDPLAAGAKLVRLQQFALPGSALYEVAPH